MARALPQLLPGLLLGLGCSSRTFLEAPEPPAEVRFLAAVALDPETGEASGGTSIVARTEGFRLELELEGKGADELVVELAGWTHSVSPAHLGDGAALGPIRAAVGCEAPLPEPDWRAPLRGEPGPAWPRLTTPTLAKTCPELLAPGVSEPLHLCGRNYCGQSISQDGCSIELRTAGCGVERTVQRGAIDAYGRLCFPEAEGCLTRAAPPGVFRRLECDLPEPCTVDWVRPSARTPALQVLRRELVATEPFPTQASVAQPSDANSGALQDLLISDQEVLVLARGHDRLVFGEGAASSRLLRLDPESLELRRETPLPDGVGALAWSKDRESLVAVRLDPIAEITALLRLSLEGAVLEEHALPLASPLNDHHSSMLREVPEFDLYLLMVDASSNSAHIMSFDRETLAPRAVCWPDFSVKATDVLPISADELWLSENEDDYLPLVSLSRCERVGAMVMDTPGNFGMGYFLPKPGSDRVLLTLGGLSGNSVSGARLAMGERVPSRGASFYESFMIPTRLAAVSSQPGLALAAVHSTRGDESARLAWFDLESELFLPGSVELGRGMVARILDGGDGVFYLLMGRSGAVVRVAISPP